MADPMAVKIVLHQASSVLIEVGKGDIHLPVFLCRRMEMPQDAAKRVLRLIFGQDAVRVVSLPIITRIGIEDIPEEERKTWPKGAKTIPCIAFSFAAGESVSLPGYEWMGKGEWNKLPDKADRMVLESLS
ncbi:MAG: hypothetical protein KBS81_10230 [Spirochaetales bacterium]|nr:hypothetical protein [Candidatus Physcosoma equi]